MEAGSSRSTFSIVLVEMLAWLSCAECWGGGVGVGVSLQFSIVNEPLTETELREAFGFPGPFSFTYASGNATIWLLICISTLHPNVLIN